MPAPCPAEHCGRTGECARGQVSPAQQSAEEQPRNCASSKAAPGWRGRSRFCHLSKAYLDRAQREDQLLPHAAEVLRTHLESPKDGAPGGLSGRRLPSAQVMVEGLGCSPALGSCSAGHLPPPLPLPPLMHAFPPSDARFLADPTFVMG